MERSPRSDSAGLGLEGRAKRVARLVGTARTDRDLGRGAAGLHVVIVAVLNTALDPLDMLATASVFVSLVLFHFLIILSGTQILIGSVFL